MKKTEKNKIIIEDIIYDILKPFKIAYYKIKNKCLIKKYNKKSIIFKNKNNIYYKENNNIFKYSNYSTLFSSNIWTPTYHYSVKSKTIHEHDFEAVLRSLYFYPESFEILNENKEEYSKQELKFIENIKKELLKLNYKDCEKDNEPIYEEYLKRNCKKYYDNVYYYNLYTNNKEIIEKQKRKIKMIVKIIFIIIVLWLIMLLTDIICINKISKPIFMINKNNTYYGLFYKAVDNKVGTYFMKKSKAKFKIIDNTKTCDQAEEKFYEDQKNEYYFSCIKSVNIKIIYQNKEYNLKEALENKIITIDELKEKIKFITKTKN